MESFSELKLSAPIEKALSELGYTKPSPIQAQTLPILLGEPTDFIGLAATGTGKTAAFSIPLLEKIDAKLRKVQALVLCPTRELAVQVTGQINLMGKHAGIVALPVYGGAGYRDQLEGLRRGSHIVVGTPGRLLDHLERGTISLKDLKIFILDEADEMISMGFREDLEKILSKAPEKQSNIWLFSATMSREVRRVADTYLQKPQQVQINRTEMLSQTVEQLYYVTKESNKPEILCKLIDAAEDFYGIIFCQTKILVTDLTRYLSDRGYDVDCLHGDKDQKSREHTMQSFRDRNVKMLVCTDVASRGLDVKDVTHVINYSLPRELDSYVHRIGRTARSGKQGFAMSLVNPSSRGLIQRIENATKSKMKPGVIPSRKEVGQKKVGQILARFKDNTSFERAQSLLTPEWKEALASMTNEEVTARFISMIQPELFEAPQKEIVEVREPQAQRAPREEGRERRHERQQDRWKKRGPGPRRQHDRR